MGSSPTVSSASNSTPRRAGCTQPIEIGRPRERAGGSSPSGASESDLRLWPRGEAPSCQRGHAGSNPASRSRSPVTVGVAGVHSCVKREEPVRFRC